MNAMKINNATRRSALRRTALAVAIVAGVGMTGQVFAQATTSTIFGSAPAVTGETVQIVGNNGFNRTVPVDSTGRYSLTVPVGTYTVNLVQNGQVVQSKSDVTTRVGGGAEVSFNGGAAPAGTKNLSTVTVTANAIPAIDVSSTRQTMVVTSQELKVLPLAKNAEAIALLAPGTAYSGSSLGSGPAGTPLLSFSGNTAVENAYYINGFNTTDPIGGAGGVALPYFAIDQQQTITSGYGAEYGRSTGGVISQIGKRGTNEWHAGARVSFQPDFLEGSYKNIYYNNGLVTTAGQTKGSLYQNQHPDSDWSQVYDAYVSGPLIKDKLFFYVSAEWQHNHSEFEQPLGSHIGFVSSSHTAPKVYTKLDWNINDSNVLELTGIKTTYATGNNTYYQYNYDNQSLGPYIGEGQHGKNSFKVAIAKYTGYITDDITVEAMYGKMWGTNYATQPAYPGFDPTLPSIAGSNLQNPAYTGGNPNGITNSNGSTGIGNPAHASSDENLRLSLDWKLGGGHDVKVGIDNMTTLDKNDGTVPTGPGYYWNYGQVNVGNPVQGTPGTAGWVDAPSNYPGGTCQGANGPTSCYVGKTVYITGGSFKVSQRAQYVMDNWQVTPNLLLNLGLRNDQFTNFNSQGVPYVREHSPQWAPRLGFSWDINGDGSEKLYGNVGRYYLALPTGLGVREASGSFYAAKFFTYTGVDANGIPQGLTPINSLGGVAVNGEPGYVSANNEYGQPLDPNWVHATNLKAEYQDEFVLGFQKQIAQGYVFGTQAQYIKMGRIIDDTSDMLTECTQWAAQNPGSVAPSVAYANAQGITDAQGNPVTAANLCQLANGALGFQGSVLINPGSTNTFRISNPAVPGGYQSFTVSPAQFGFPKADRKYYALDFYLEHPWDGKWFGKIDYMFSKSYGATEGPTQTATGQISSGQLGGGGQSGSITTQWDFGSLMQYARGEQANSHRHTLKVFGAYQVAPEWLVSGTLIVQTGMPNVCLGYFGPGETDPTGYATVLSGAYHWCGGKPSRPGDSGHTPVIHPLNLSVDYTPLWAQKHLDLQLQIHNVFNEQKAIQYNSFYGNTSGPSPTYKLPTLEGPRYMELSATYNW